MTGTMRAEGDALRHASLAVALAVAALAAAAVHAEDWVAVAGDRFTSLAVDRDSIVPVEGAPHVAGMWFRYRFTTAVECSPPRGCYASSHRIYNYVDCLAGSLRPVQRLYMDLNDNVLKQVDYAPWPSFPVRGSIEGEGMIGACAIYRSRYPEWWRYPPYYSQPSPWQTTP